MPRTTSEALTILVGSAVFFIPVLFSLSTGLTYAKGARFDREKSPVAFWVTISIQAFLGLVLVGYAGKLAFFD